MRVKFVKVIDRLMLKVRPAKVIILCYSDSSDCQVYEANQNKNRVVVKYLDTMEYHTCICGYELRAVSPEKSRA